MTTDRPLGQRYSHIYIERGLPLSDKPNWRVRLGHYVQRVSSNKQYELSSTITKEIGIVLKNTGLAQYYCDFERIYTDNSIRNILDISTIVFTYLKKGH